jgi:NAD(P)H-hydrate epimerase
VERVVTASRVPLVIDADGINALAGNINILKSAVCPIVLTPHDGEFARIRPGYDGTGRLAAATAFAVEYGVTLLLKGHRTVTALPDGRAYINTTGGPGMAKGGSGDVLSGVIAALTAQLNDAESAAFGGAYFHGLAGDICAGLYGEYAMTPSDIIENLYRAMR